MIDGKPTGGFVDERGRIGHASTSGAARPDGGPTVATWCRFYGHDDATIRRGLIALVPELAKFAARRSRDLRTPTAEQIADADRRVLGDETDDQPPPPPDADGNPRPKRKPKPSGILKEATRYVRTHAMHADGPTLRRWRSGWYLWSSELGLYKEISDEGIDKSLYADFGLGKRQEVSDLRHALPAVDGVLIDEAELGAWIGSDVNNTGDVAACRNGLLDLRTRTLTPSSPRYFATTVLGVEYDETAGMPVGWLEFLRQLWPDDPESIATLQEWFGYLLTADTRQQKIMLLTGPPRCGKGTIMRVHTALLGAASVAGMGLASLGTNFGMWPLIGKPAWNVADARLGGRSDIAQIVSGLLSISGEDEHTIDRKHREPWTGYLSTRITIASNELPRFADASGALASRMLILEIGESWLGREDTGLTDRLLGELPGILSWAIEGWERLHARGHFVQPTSSAGTVNDLIDLGSPVAAWIRERCEKGRDFTVGCQRAYQDFVTWCDGEGSQHKATMSVFGRDLKANAQSKRIQVRDGLAKPYFYTGIRLRE
ncbi:MAG: phage/plasmid primase, P4 family [Proteobacteria bacterium]|nr:phage/plasmid primase, P4 family [Pseudomonadota bacterium]